MINLDITPDSLPDHYLVMTGPKSLNMSSRGGIRPWLIEHVYLFDAQDLVRKLKSCGVMIGMAASVRKGDWGAAEFYPNPNNKEYVLTQEQKGLLRLFGR